MAPEAVNAFAGKFAAAIVNPILLLLFAVGLLWFLYGVVKYLYMLNVKGEQENDGKKHMLWGLVGMFIMVAALAIIKLISSTIGAPLPPGY